MSIISYIHTIYYAFWYVVEEYTVRQYGLLGYGTLRPCDMQSIQLIKYL